MPFSFIAAHNSVTGSSATTSVSFTLAAGQSLVCMCADGNNQGATLTVSDNFSNIYNRRATTNDTFNGESYAVSECTVPTTTGAVTVTLTTSAGATGDPGLVVLVYTGLASFDHATAKWADSGWSTSTNGAQSTAITPGGQPGLLVAMATGLGGTITADAGASSRFSSTGWVNGQNCQIEDYRFTSTGSQVANFTFSSASASNAILAATFLEPPPPVVSGPYFFNSDSEM